jgi:pimeloyl-ACP methyl ester carboxylesterase
MRQTWLSWFPRAELVTLAGAGHYSMDETPLELIRTVEDFLRADGEEVRTRRESA